MSITATDLQAEILAVEGVNVVVLNSAPGELFESYSKKWPHGLADDRTLSAFKRRLAHSLAGRAYGILKSDGQRTTGAGNVRMGTIRGISVEA